MNSCGVCGATAARPGIACVDIDPEFGVIETDPGGGHHNVLVDEADGAPEPLDGPPVR